MNHQNDDDWLDEIITRATDIGKVEFDRPKWLDKLAAEPQEVDMPSPRTHDEKYKPHWKIWRTIMESRITRYSAAAVIVLAMTLVLFGPFWTPGNGGVVLADVQKKVAGIETMIIRGTKTFTHPGEPDRIFEFDGIKCQFDILRYHSTRYGLVEEGYAEGRLIYRITFNIPEGQTLILFPKYKKYLKFASMDAFAKAMEIFGTPNGILNLYLGGDYKKLGRDEIDGIDVEAFEFEDTEPFELFKELLPKTVFDIQTFKGTVWIGIKEQLPVRVEGDLAIGKSITTVFNDLNLHEVNTFGDYNIELDEHLFDINAPEGYTQVTLSDIFQFIPAQAKAGLVGLGIAPAGFVFWRRQRRRKTTTDPG